MFVCKTEKQYIIISEEGRKRNDTDIYILPYSERTTIVSRGKSYNNNIIFSKNKFHEMKIVINTISSVSTLDNLQTNGFSNTV